VLLGDDVTFEPGSYVFVEGLALLRLADRFGIGPQRREYPRCPYLVRMTPLRARPDDIFLEIEQMWR
jgi:hypothetical protein